MDEKKTHKVRIECQECNLIQNAIVEVGIPFNTYVHECIGCGYTITESEWVEIKPQKELEILIAANPGMDIKFLVAEDAAQDSGYPYCCCRLSSVEKDLYIEYNEKIYNCYDDLEEDILNNIFEDWMDEKKADSLVKEEMEKIEEKEVIYVYIDAL